MAQHWAEGTRCCWVLVLRRQDPVVRPVGWLIVLTTKGIDGSPMQRGNAEPIVFEKVVLYTMLFEVIGWAAALGR